MRSHFLWRSAGLLLATLFVQGAAMTGAVAANNRSALVAQRVTCVAWGSHSVRLSCRARATSREFCFPSQCAPMRRQPTTDMPFVFGGLD